MASKRKAARRHKSDPSRYATDNVNQVKITTFFPNTKEKSPGKLFARSSTFTRATESDTDSTVVNLTRIFPLATDKAMVDVKAEVDEATETLFNDEEYWDMDEELETEGLVVKDTTDYFKLLPDELIENILCQLPILDLLLHCTLVCQRWNDVIGSDKFIPMKKRYALLANEDEEATNEVEKICIQCNLLDEPQHLAHNLALHFVMFRSRNKHLRKGLKKHSKYHLVKRYLKSGTDVKAIKRSPWSIVALLTLVSSTVSDISEIISTMLGPFTNCLIIEVIECLYSLAGIYLELKKQNRIVSGLHYRVFYALYLFENAFSATCGALQSSASLSEGSTGQQSITRYRSATDSVRLTHEQVQIVKHDIKPLEIIKIIAFAGTGKTTTLIQYTKLRPSMQFLNVAYNKSIQLQAEKLFPKANVESRTMHSLAFREVGYRYKHKMVNSIKISVVSSALPSSTGNTFLHAKRVADTVTSYISSARRAVSTMDVPARKISVNEMFNATDYFDSEEYLTIVARDAAKIWSRMCDMKDMEMRMTHDGYLKLYQLSNPVIHGYDCILIDEAQDNTPAASDVLLRQHCAKILVGDPHQQIYGFRGAKNAMETVESTRTFYLTQSFRFGPEIAYVANCVLESLMKVHRKTLVGGAQPGGVFGDAVGQIAVICRTNFTLFDEAQRLCRQQNGVKVGFAGGLHSYSLDRVLDIYKLFIGPSEAPGIKDSFIKRFKSISTLRQYAQNAPDPELMGKIKIVEKHTISVPICVEAIKRKACDMEHADVVFSTAHKAKGLEFSTVRVADDFLLEADYPGADLVDQDEKNLLYVAVTRAKTRLQMTHTIMRVLSSRHEKFLRPVCLKRLSEEVNREECVNCYSPLDSKPNVIMERPKILLGGDHIELRGGVYCTQCAVEIVPHLSVLL